MGKMITKGHVKRIWINFRRENDLLKIVIVFLVSITFSFYLKSYSNEPWATILSNLIAIAAPLLYALGRLFFQELNILKTTRPENIGSNGEVKFQVNEIPGATSAIIALENGFYTVRDSRNVSSIIDNGYGDIGINFVSPFKDSNFICNVSGDGALEWELINKSLSSIRIKFKKEPKFFKIQVS